MKVAVAQAEPEWMDLEASVVKTCGIVAEAASQGAELVAFPECWIPGYPLWIWSRPVDFDLSIRYMENCLAVESPQMKRIQQCAHENEIVVALGFSERCNNSLYIAQCTIDKTGEIVMKRRKMVPTHMERTVFGNGSGGSLTNVAETAVGEVGQLACWEHTQPLLKYHTISQHEKIHISAWPPVFPYGGTHELLSMAKEGTMNLSSAYAIEAGAFVLMATAVLSSKGIEVHKTVDGALMNKPGGGCSAIFAPDGRVISKSIDDCTEGLIYAELDINEILKVKSMLDCVGHYSRPDLLWLGVDKTEKSHVR